MRKLVFLALLVAGIWWFRSHRQTTAADVTVGYADGSAVTLEPGAPEHDRLLQIARAVVGR